MSDVWKKSLNLMLIGLHRDYFSYGRLEAKSFNLGLIAGMSARLDQFVYIFYLSLLSTVILHPVILVIILFDAHFVAF
jgi:hypothetical protein